jgi:toxin-antitoxin system PIN domain toxin
VNVLVYAHRRDVEGHDAYRDWLDAAVNGQQPFGLSDLVLSGFVRVVTHPSVFTEPASTAEALEAAARLRQSPNRVEVAPGPRHWSIFVELCRRVKARGNAVPDAFLAALAIESGSEWITTDRGFARFPDLRWRHPLDHA